MKKIFYLMFLQIFMTGCSLEEYPELSKPPYELSDVLGPTVISIQPLADSRDIPLDTIIMVKFSEAVLPESVDELSFYIRSKTEKLTGTYIFSDDQKSIYFLPEKQLEPLTQYTITLNNRITDLSGNELVDQDPNDKLPATPFTSLFTTGEVKELE